MYRLGTFALLFLMGMAFFLAGSRVFSSAPANAMDVSHPPSQSPPSYELTMERTNIADLGLPVPEDVLGNDLANSLAGRESVILLDSSVSPPHPVFSDRRAPEVFAAQEDEPIDNSLDEAPEKLLIPSLRVNAKIVYVPFSGMTWDISDLGQDIAWLGSPTGKTNRHNLTLAGHVTLYDGRNGPLYSAARLKPGDLAYVYSATRAYTYRLQSISTVYPEDISILDDTTSPQLTLITCTTWDEETSSYLRRLVFQFNLIKVELRTIHLNQ